MRLIKIVQIILLLCCFSFLRADEIKLSDLESISESETMVMIPMRDGVRLATDIYRPKENKETLPLVFIKTPYNFNEIQGATLQWTYEAVKRGYAVAIQNERGRYYSEGEWEILGNPRTDGFDALSWFVEQSWSNGNIGTLGCSSSAEWQMALAFTRSSSTQGYGANGIWCWHWACG